MMVNGRTDTTEMMRAASRGDYPAAARLLPASDVNARDQFGNTALLYAAGAGHAEIVRLLLLAGADPAARNDAGSDARRRALASDRQEVLRLLAAASGEDGVNGFLTAADRRLLECCRKGDASGAVAELDRGASRDARSPEGGWTPLIAACAGGHTDVARLLVARGADTESQAAGGRRALHFAAELRDVALVRLLLEAGADPDPPDFAGVTPREASTREGSAEVVRALEERMAAVRG